ncbi:hypothetical protein AM501_04965 [Aneurinibacillus migulanus]|uniref:hypothetical protein n=1 Tax=Aneurinibacillus migulanus TaxID=47500 RepID=UPI0005B7F82F|nr:hypothetical protein [Aneurinibacillus migulanus]KIV55526.1 hypothetical protein TS64_11800 [Aneurinibacillus migulanus]KPD09313.1 hypothetical protein AM501_04965 [Aneurinibacillus migulanus]
MHASACSLIFFSQGRDTAALWHQGRTGKTSGFFECGRRTAARLGHGVVTIQSGSYWIINTLDEKKKNFVLNTAYSPNNGCFEKSSLFGLFL